MTPTQREIFEFIAARLEVDTCPPSRRSPIGSLDPKRGRAARAHPEPGMAIFATLPVIIARWRLPRSAHRPTGVRAPPLWWWRVAAATPWSPYGDRDEGLVLDRTLGCEEGNSSCASAASL